MASIQGVKVTGVIVPSDTLDTYAVIDPIYGIDGLRNLSGGTSALSGITSDRRRAGMLVGVNNGANYYKLNPAPWNNTISDWTPFSLGSAFTGGTVTGSTSFTGGLSANTFSATTYQNLPKLQNVITVAKGGGDFTSIKAAVDSITTSSDSNRYIIRVAPGIYQENEINLTSKPYISIVGFDIQTTVVIPATSTQNIFRMGNNTELSFMTLSGTGVGYAAISNIDLNGFALVHKLSMYDNDTNILVQSNTANTNFYGEYLDFNGKYSYGTNILASNGFQAYANMENYYNYPTGTGICIANNIQGSGATLSVFIGDGIGNGVTGSTNYQLSDYASLNTISTTADSWDYGIRVLSSGGPSKFDIDSYSVVDSISYDLSIEHQYAEGTFGGGSSTHSKIHNISDKVYWAFLDTNDGEFEITRKLSVTFQDGTHTDMSTLIFQGSTMGLIYGGIITSGTGLTVNVSNGYGYVEKVASTETIKRIDWDATSISLSGNSSLYIFFNESGILSFSGSRPAMKNNIILGRVVTNSTGIEFIDASPMNAEHTSNRFANLFREAIGPIYAFGSIVTENATPFKLNITAGEYYYSTNEYTPSGVTGSTFTQYYNNGTGGWNTSATTFVNNTQFDNNGVLSGLTASAFTKHTLYIVGDGIYEKYFLVLGQKQYGTLVECENALLPTPPTFFNDSVAQVANIYIKQGNPNILQIEDIRPVIGFKAGGVNASSLHANLLGLASDDHKQYLLGDGSRAMSGTLKMGNNPIISAGTINNVTIESHAARHKHGGADEISTVTPTASAIPKADTSGKLDTWISNASSTLTGTTKLSVNPAIATNPIAVGVNDQRFLKSITGITSVGDTIAFKDVSGGTTTINDVRVTGGTYNSGTGITTFKNSINNTFDVSGYFKPGDDIYVANGNIDHDLNVISLVRTDSYNVVIDDIVTVIEKSRDGILNLINDSKLVKGVTYKITNCDNELYISGIIAAKQIYTTVYLKAIENNILADTGVGLFYTPKYINEFGWNIWSNLNVLEITMLSGEFITNETIVGDNGSIGLLFGDVTSGFFYNISGDWDFDTIITGQESGAQASIDTLIIKEYQQDEVIFWGGTAWYIKSKFKIGAAIDLFNLDAVNYPLEQILPLNDVSKDGYYNISYDEIKYDIASDRITYRKDKNNNIVSTTPDNIKYWENNFTSNPIKAFKWGHVFGNDGTGIGNQKIVNSYNENINFRGHGQFNIEMENLSYQKEIYSEGVHAMQFNLYLSNSNQTDVRLTNYSYQIDITLINSIQSNININDNSRQSNIRLENSSSQRDLNITKTSSQANVTVKNSSKQEKITIKGNSKQGIVIFENGGEQLNAIIQNQTNTKFYNFSFDRLNNNIIETNKIYTNTLAIDNSAPQVIGIMNNELVEVDVSSLGGASPIEVVNSDSLFSTVLNAGIGSNANGSNFFGFQAGYGALSASYSNFIGQSAGQFAKNAVWSNFIGVSAGNEASGASYSNFFGLSAGYWAYDANNSNFFGQNAGSNAINADNSNFIGQAAGSGATGASQSNFLGVEAGYGALNAAASNFLGSSAGWGATDANYSNFFGNAAGYEATGASKSNFFGVQVGYQATNASNSNFMSDGAGYGATGASYSNFFGVSAGGDAIDANNSNFFGNGAGQSAFSANTSNFFGVAAGATATGASNSNFFGDNTGYGATDASHSNFMGYVAGSSATGASYSNFFGYTAGLVAFNANNSNFFGQNAGNNARNANNSNFFGYGAGYSATSANNSNFIGQAAGYKATGANSSNFIGQNAGNNAKNAQYSNFMGWQAGLGATGATGSNFIGYQAGYSATTAINSNLIGYQAGKSFVGNNIGSNNIIIGTNISLPNGATNRINLGGVLFGTGTYSINYNDPSIVPTAAGRIGIAVINPTKRLHISGETANDSGLRLELLTSASPVSTGQAIGVDSLGNVVTIASGGGVTPIYTAVTTSSVLTNANQTVIVNSLNAITITLPQITSDGRLITIKNINTGIETILPYAGQLIDGDASIIVARKNVSLDLQSYNNNWYVI